MTTSETKISQCEWCGSDLTAEEIADPIDGDFICCECDMDNNYFDCIRCGESEHNDHQHEFAAVLEPISGGYMEEVTPGIYQIVKFPYYTSGVIGRHWLHADALKRVADLDFPSDDSWYPMGHLCQGCITAITNPTNQKD